MRPDSVSAADGADAATTAAATRTIGRTYRRQVRLDELLVQFGREDMGSFRRLARHAHPRGASRKDESLKAKSPDLRIITNRGAFPCPGHSGGRLGRAPRSPVTGSLPAYSGGTVWDSHPLPLTSGKRRKPES